MLHSYLLLTDCPAPGMIYLGNGQYLFPAFFGAEAENAVQCCGRYLIKVENSYTVTSETDGGCDRICETTEYLELAPENIIIKDGEPVGFYLNLGYYYSVSPKKPNIHVFYISETKSFHHCSGTVYTLIAKESGRVYESSSHIY